MIDYENVRLNGMKGCEFLVPGDSIELFFSDSCSTITHGIFESLKKCGCSIRICKLQNVRKNALDFYIASRIGELMGTDYHGKIIIVSNDKGFQSVQDYWKYCSVRKLMVLLCGSIADGILSSNHSDERTFFLKEQEKKVSIEVEYAKYKESLKIRSLLEEQFSDTEFMDYLDEIEDVFRNRSEKKILYLDSIKRFGKRDGTQIYNQIKKLTNQ